MKYGLASGIACYQAKGIQPRDNQKSREAQFTADLRALRMTRLLVRRAIYVAERTRFPQNLQRALF